jgi:gamma-glutamyltranspeptidase/glutathione hydrolase
VQVLEAGGSAVDAAVAAQAVICTVVPQAAGLGGDLLALVHRPGRPAVAVNGVGRSPAAAPARWGTDGGSSVTVPGLVDGWLTLHGLGGRLDLGTCLAPARAAAEGHPVSDDLAGAARTHAERLRRHGAGGWPPLTLPAGAPWVQPELGALLDAVAADGRAAFYEGRAAEAVAAAVRGCGGTLSADDLAAHRTTTAEPVAVAWDGGRLLVQPPSTQGVLLAMAAQWLERSGRAPGDLAEADHVLVELVGAAFAHRADVVARGAALLDEPLAVDPDRASGSGGPRSYLHTAGVAVADADGTVVSSLVSVFDDFGSGVLVPELGIVLGNRAAGFTDGANAPGPGRYPVHTLAPALLERDGGVLALATPGADGQVQTLLQVLARLRYEGAPLADALDGPRWRSEDGRLLVEQGHPAAAALRALGHDVVDRPSGEDVFGAVVAAGHDGAGPHAAADRRRGVTAGAAA